MSKKLNGIYGTLNAKKLYDAVVETCVKNGCTIKSFFKDTYKDHDEKWFQHVKKRNYGEMHDIQKLCSLVDCSFDSLVLLLDPDVRDFFPKILIMKTRLMLVNQTKRNSLLVISSI